jgi:hypothetical protein
VASALHSVPNMRNALLIAIGLASVSILAVGCGDASTSTIQRGRGATGIPAPGTDQMHDPNAPDEPADPVNPNATTLPPAPATAGVAAGTLAVTVDNATPAADLGGTVDVTVSVEPKAGFTGTATLSVTGLPTGATATFAPPTVTLNTTAVTSKLTITVPATAAPSEAATPAALVITATAPGAAGAAPVVATANANFKVNPKITMTIPVNADAMRAAVGTRYVDGWFGPMFGTAPQSLQTQADNPITVVVKNADSVSHIVHGNAGFVHGDTAVPVPPGAVDPKNRTLKAGVMTSGYLHEGANGTSESFRITVNTVAP